MFEDFYGLSGRPFQLTPDPAFYYESLTHRKALSYLGYGLAQGEGFVVITGEVGAGKSTLVAHLMATIDPARLTAAQVVTSALDGEEIIHVVAQAFGLPVTGHDKASALGAIESFLHDEARAGRRCLLIVDESQNLAIGALEELRMLSNFQLGSHPLLQTLLLGQPEFRTLLLEHPGVEQLRQRVIATHHLQAMEGREVQLYIEHRLRCVGWTGHPAFDTQLFAEIHDAAGGIPRRINQVVNRLLLLGALEQRDTIDVSMLAAVLDELDEDGTIAIVSGTEAATAQAAATADGSASAPAAQASVPATEAPELASQASAFQASAALAQMQAALAERDAQIRELQQAVVELAQAAEEREDAAAARRAEDAARRAEDAAHRAEQAALVAALNEQVADAEGRLAEQERTLRHTLTMLIEWIESGEGPRVAA